MYGQLRFSILKLTGKDIEYVGIIKFATACPANWFVFMEYENIRMCVKKKHGESQQKAVK